MIRLADRDVLILVALVVALGLIAVALALWR